MYFGGSVVSKASTIGIEISPTPPLIFTGGQKVRNLAFFNITQIWAARVWKCSKISELWDKFLCRNDRPMSSQSLVKLGPRTFEDRWAQMPHPLIARRKRAKSWIISLKFCTDFGRVGFDVTRTFKVNGSKVHPTTWHNVSASQRSYNSNTDKLSKVKLGESYDWEPSATRYTSFKVIKSNIEIAITLPRIARLRSNLVQSFITSQATHCKCLRSKVKGQGHWSEVKVTS